jgi:hypothetical protein
MHNDHLVDMVYLMIMVNMMYTIPQAPIASMDVDCAKPVLVQEADS